MEHEEKIDKYGFINPKKLSFPEKHHNENTQIQNWELIIEDWDENIQKRKNFIKKSIRKGIPNSFRGVIWCKLSKIQKIKSKFPPDYYNELAFTVSESPNSREIEADVNRTFPNHILFRNNEGGKSALTRILKAYSFYDSELGYSSGISFIAGLFLLFMSEEDAFWVLVSIMTIYGMRDLYMPDIGAIYKIMYELNSLFKEEISDLWDHFNSFNLSPSIFAASWIKTIYSIRFPMESVLRILDCFFNEGVEVLLRIYLTMFKIKKRKIVEIDSERIIEYINEIPYEISPDELIKRSFDLSVSSKKLNELAEEFMNEPNREIINW